MVTTGFILFFINRIRIRQGAFVYFKTLQLQFWNIDTDTHVSAAQAVTQYGPLVVVGDAGTVGHLIGEFGGVAAEGSSHGNDGGGIVVVWDSDDEISARRVDQLRVVDDVDLTEFPEVTRRWIYGLNQKRSTAWSHRFAKITGVLWRTDTVESFLSVHTGSSVPTRVARTLVSVGRTGGSVPAWSTDTLHGASRAVQRARASVQTRVCRTTPDTCFAMSSLITGVTLADISVDQIRACTGVQTRVRGALVDVVLTEQASIAWYTLTLHAVDCIYTRGAVLTRFTLALVDIILTVCSVEPGHTVAVVTTVHLEYTGAAVLTGCRGAVSYVSFAVNACVSNAASALIASVCQITNASVLAWVTLTLVYRLLAELTAPPDGTAAEQRSVSVARAAVLTRRVVADRCVASAADDHVSISVGRSPDPEGILRHGAERNPRTATSHSVTSHLVGFWPCGVIKAEIIPCSCWSRGGAPPLSVRKELISRRMISYGDHYSGASSNHVVGSDCHESGPLVHGQSVHLLPVGVVR